MPSPNALVPVTIDGTVRNIAPGVYSFAELKAVANQPKATLFTINQNSPSPNSTIGGNGSVTIRGGEVMTSTHP